MSFKEMFNKGDRQEKFDQSYFEKQVRRINTLEVHVSRLIKLESKLSPLLLQKTHPDAKREKSFDEGTREQGLFLNQEIERIKRRLTLLEVNVQKGEENGYNHANRTTSFINQELLTKMNRLETNLSLVNQLQLDILKQLDSARKQYNELQQHFASDDAGKEQPIVHKEIYVDKVFLEKYEQNNNIAQVGIRELSGALNIGATYGTVPLPIATEEEPPTQQEDTFAGGADSEQSSSEVAENSFSEIPIEGDSDFVQEPEDY